MTDNVQPLAGPPVDQQIPPGAVVVGLDGSAPSSAALRWAGQEAAFLGRPLHLITVQDHAPGLLAAETPTAWLQYESEQHRVCTDLLRQARDQAGQLFPGVTVTASCPEGRPSQHLMDASGRAFCVVVGNRGRGQFAATMLGTVSLQVAAHSRGPVVVVRTWTEDQMRVARGPRRAVVGVDDSEDSRAAIRFALDHVGPDGTVELLLAWWLEVVDGIVVTTPGSPQWEQVTTRHETVLRSALREATGSQEDSRVRLRVERALPAQALVEAAGAARTDLVVVGTRGRGGFRGLVLGSVSQHVLVSASGPVAVVQGNR